MTSERFGNIDLHSVERCEL